MNRRSFAAAAVLLALALPLGAAASGPADIERWLLSAASTPRADELSRKRLEKAVAAFRARGV